MCKRLIVFVRWILRSDILETDSQVIMMLKKSWLVSNKRLVQQEESMRFMWKLTWKSV